MITHHDTTTLSSLDFYYMFLHKTRYPVVFSIKEKIQKQDNEI